MSNLTSETTELSLEALDNVAGGMAFFGSNCSLNRNSAIGALIENLFSIPMIGGALACVATRIGRAICS